MKRFTIYGAALGLAAAFSFAQSPPPVAEPAPAASPAPPTAYETPPVFRASEILPANLLVGPHHRVRELAPSDGYLIHFTIDSDYGVFECAGRRRLRQCTGEIAAIAKLVEVSKSDLFAEGLKRSVEKPIEAVKNIAEHPKESLRQAPKTVGHFFGKVGSSIGNAAKRVGKSINESQQNGDTEKAVKGVGRGLGQAAKSAAGFDQAKLETARQLGVDPYSDNRRLQEEMEKVTWAFFAGGLPLRIGTAVASGGASLALTATKTLGLPGDIYDLTPAELALRDREALEAMGAAATTIDRIFVNPALTVSLRHAIVTKLKGFPGGPNRLSAVSVAASCETIAQARFLNDALGMLLSRQNAAPYTALTTIGRLPGGFTSDGVVEVAAPVDFISWTEQVANFARRDDLARNPHRLVLNPDAGISPAARAGMKAAGWDVAGGNGQ
jgi:hypothetical protein